MSVDFEFDFQPTGNSQGGNAPGGNRREVNWDDLNAHIIEQAKTAKGNWRSLPAVITGLVDLGIQNQDYKEVVSDTPLEDEAEVMEKYPTTTFKDGFDENGKPARIKRYRPNPVQQVVYFVDLPQVMVDKSKYISGESKPMPLRLSLNGEFTVKGEDGKNVRIVGRPFNVREVKHDDGTWAFAKNSQIHKMAEATGQLTDAGYFHKNMIGKLIGKHVQVQFRIYMKEGKNGGSFFTEDIKLVGMVPEGVPLPEVNVEHLFGVNMWRANKPEAVKQLRANVKNTIRRAINQTDPESGAVAPLIQELDALEAGNGAARKPAASAPAEKPQGIAPTKPAPAADDDSFDDDVPF